MPRIPDHLLACVVYVNKPNMGKEGRATGFITCVEENGKCYQYVVTNSHVIDQREISVYFFATGEVVSLPMHRWESSKESDLAVCLLNGNMQGISRLRPIPRSSYVSHTEHMQIRDLGIGDDVFMVGRFLPAENRGLNKPTVRFGNISVWPPSDGIQLKGDDKPVWSFLAEMRSRSGCSGSPVFLSVEPGSMNLVRLRDSNIGFLGVDRGHVTDDYRDTPMAAIIPDQKLIELLDSEKLRQQRDNT